MLKRYQITFKSGEQRLISNIYADNLFQAAMMANQMLCFILKELKTVYEVIEVKQMDL